jgi:hypothetical protein
LRSCWATTTTRRKHNHPQSYNNNNNNNNNSNNTEVGSTPDLARTGNSSARIFASMDSSAPAAPPAFVDPIHSIPSGSGGMGAVSSDDHHHHHGEDLEDLLYQMVVWLCSHEVLVPLQDYVIAKFPLTTTTTKATVADRSDHRHRRHAAARHDRNLVTEHKSDDHANDLVRLDHHLGSSDNNDWMILRELLDSDCLSGRISVPACCWKTGLDPVKVYQLVARRPQQLRVVTRLPVPGDDWEEL